MAEEILVKEYLSPEMISAGRDLIARLDAADWHPTSAFWLFDLERNRWKLVLSSPEIEKNGSVLDTKRSAECLPRMNRLGCR